MLTRAPFSERTYNVSKIILTNVSEQGGISLTPDMVQALGAAPGDTIYMIASNGSIQFLTKNSPLYKQLQAAHDAMEADQETLRMLAE